MYFGDEPFRLSFLSVGHAPGEVTLSKVEAGSHSGTHIDAPLHFIPGAASVDQIDPSRLVSRATIVDMSHKPLGHPITASDLKQYLDKSEGLLIYTGISRLRKRDEYLHLWPYLDRSAADAIAEAGVRLVGVDAMSVSGWPGAPGAPWPPLVSAEDVAYVHERLLGAGILVVEGLCGLEQLIGHCDEVEAIVAPIKVRGAEAAMARVLALC